MRARRYLSTVAARIQFRIVPCFCAVAYVVAPNCAEASIRPLFEPTDLELEDPGVIDFDFQLGVIRGRDPWRIVVPDFEFDFGVSRNFELDLDGTYALEGTSHGPFDQPHALPDALWTSLKVGLVDWYDDKVKQAWAAGFQVGPKFPVARGNQGLGAEGLMLLGYTWHKAHFVLNAGMLADPRPDSTLPHPVGIELGLDLQVSLDSREHYAFLGELSGVRFITDYPHQALSTAGFQYSPSKYLDLSIVALYGWLGGSDRYGLLFGVSPKLKLFSAE